MSYSKLRGRIRERFKSQADFAVAIGKSVCAVNQKLNGKSEWNAQDMRKACDVLGIDPADIPAYFFYPEC
jgi:transcriptional regulator with XRE-family HTH domain